MKASVKVRDGQKPLVRARVPVSLLGIPLFSAISLGNPQELALHLGSCVEEGPLFKVTYKPNDLQSPCSLLIKTGVGIWGSPAGAALAMAAEFSFSGKMTPSFMLRVKPRIGDFSLTKDTGHWSTGAKMREAIPAPGQSELTAVETQAWTVGLPINGRTEESRLQDDVSASEPLPSQVLEVSDGLQGRTSIAVKRCEMGVVNGRNGYMDSGSPAPNSHGESSDNFGPSTLDRAKGFGSVVSHLESSRNTSGHFNTLRNGEGSEHSDESCVFVTGFEEKEPGSEVAGALREPLPAELPLQEKKLLQKASGALSICNSWCLRAHSSLPLGKLAVLSVRWKAKVPTDLYQGNFTIAKLPLLVMDKITLESTRPSNRRLSAPDHSPYALGHDYVTAAPLDEKDELLHHMTSMFSSMRHQLHHLHTENRAFKKALEELKVEVGSRGGSLVRFRGPANMSPGDLLIQEENMLRSQMFDEMQTKTKDARANSSSKREADGKHEPRGKKDRDQRNDPKNSESSSALVFGNSGSTSPGKNSVSESEVSEELKKAIMNATSGGR